MERHSGKEEHPSGRKNATARLDRARARPKYLDELVFIPDRGTLSAPNGEDIVVINRKTLGRVFEGMREMLQSGSDLIWYNAGDHTGEAEGRRLKKAMTKMGPEGFLRMITDLYTNLGWGRTTFRGLDLKGRSVVIQIWNDPLTREVTSTQPVCHYIKGFYRGFCAVVFQSGHVTVEETSCEATGAEHCEFSIKW